jgi:uncharacterized protein DUF6677
MAKPAKQETLPVEPPITVAAVGTLVAGWLLPGMGHIIQRRWWRGTLLFVSIVAMFALGLAMQGQLYGMNLGDLLDILGFIGDLGAGLLYFVCKAMDIGAASVSLATADFGGKFLIVAGLLNIVAAVDAYDIALGKKK